MCPLPVKRGCGAGQGTSLGTVQNETDSNFSPTYDPHVSLPALTYLGKEVRMIHWVESHRLSSDLKFKISLLILGFIAVGVLMTFFAYTSAR